MATFDAAVNNTDRKGGHILPVDGGATSTASITGCASRSRRSCGPCCGAGAVSRCWPTSSAGLGRIREALGGDLGSELRELLSRVEIRATIRRVDDLLERGIFPLPSPTWPAIPWPPI